MTFVNSLIKNTKGINTVINYRRLLFFCPTYQCTHPFAQLTSYPVSTNCFKYYAQQFQSLALFCTQLISSTATCINVCMLLRRFEFGLGRVFQLLQSVQLESVCAMLILNITFTDQNQDWLRITITQVKSLCSPQCTLSGQFFAWLAAL